MDLDYDSFLSAMLRKPSYHIGDPLSVELRDLKLPGPSFLHARIPVDALDAHARFSDAGFRTYDVSVELRRVANAKTKLNAALSTGGIVRFARRSDEKAIRKIAAMSLTANRFHWDPKIGPKIATRIKEEWVGNFFQGLRGNFMVVYESSNAIEGFIQTHPRRDGILAIDLIATRLENHRRGIGRAMMGFVDRNCREQAQDLLVQTQLANLAAIKFYSTLGFRIEHASFVMHKHVPGTQSQSE